MGRVAVISNALMCQSKYLQLAFDEKQEDRVTSVDFPYVARMSDIRQVCRNFKNRLQFWTNFCNELMLTNNINHL